MLEQYLRRYLQYLFIDPVAKKLIKWPFISPSHLTIIGCLIGVLSAIAVGYGWSWTGVCLLFLSGYVDTLDGTLARLHNRTSPFGSALDIISDRIVEFSIVIGLYKVHSDIDALFSLLMLGSILVCITSFLVVGIFSENTGEKSFHYSPGLIERGEAFLFFGFMICFPNFFPALAAIFSFLVFLTAALRLYQFYQLQAYLEQDKTR